VTRKIHRNSGRRILETKRFTQTNVVACIRLTLGARLRQERAKRAKVFTVRRASGR